MTLPPWIESVAKESSASAAAFSPRLVQALAIAWEAHESISKNSCCDKCQEAKLVSVDALRRISELGEGK